MNSNTKNFLQRWFYYYFLIYAVKHTVFLEISYSLKQKYDSWLSFFYNSTFHKGLGFSFYVQSQEAGLPDSLTSFFEIFLLALSTLFLALYFQSKDKEWKNKIFEIKWIEFITKIYFSYHMFIYGTHKILPVQFSELTLFELVKPLGEFSPGNLLWAFMGFSVTYQIISGCVEVTAGLLIHIPRFTQLASLLGLIVMSNVLMLNFFYDVTVKSWSFHLLIVALMTFLKQRHFWFTFLTGMPPAKFKQPVPLLKTEKNNVLFSKIIFLCLLLIIGFEFYRMWPRYIKQTTYALTTSFYGLWSLTKEDKIQFNLKWKRFIFSEPGYLFIQKDNDTFLRMTILKKEKPDSFQYEVEDYADQKFKSGVNIKQTDDYLFVSGEIDSQDIDLKLSKEPIPKTVLLSRGFHLINEDWFGR